MQGQVSIRYNRVWNVLLGIVIDLCCLHQHILVGWQASILWQVAWARFVRISLVPYTAGSLCVLPWTQWKTRPIIIVVSRQNRQRKESHRQTHTHRHAGCVAAKWMPHCAGHGVDVPYIILLMSHMHVAVWSLHWALCIHHSTGVLGE